jgi:hypothetical protein
MILKIVVNFVSGSKVMIFFNEDKVFGFASSSKALHLGIGHHF